MNEQIEVSLERIQEIINEISDNTFTTIDIIERYSGGFYVNTQTPAYYSFNAQFGKLLKRNEDNLHITEIQKSKNAKDNNGNKTTTSVWEKRT